MANSLIPQELEDLIQEYLTDGVLTEKERQVVLKKAESLGLDRDEIDLYLDAQVQKIDIAIDSAVRKQRGKTCPYCGGSVPQLADKCPHCGETISVEASDELQEILENLEDALVDMKAGRDTQESKARVERYIRKAKLYYSNNPKIERLLPEIEVEISLAEQRAAQLKKEEKLEARKQTAGKIVSNMWFWTGLSLIVGVLLLIYSFGKDGGLVTVSLIFIGVSFVLLHFLLKKKGDNKND